jgi:hypothetical protein
MIGTGRRRDPVPAVVRLPDTRIADGLVEPRRPPRPVWHRWHARHNRDHAPYYHVALWPANVQPACRTSRKAGCVIREELTRLFTWEERHRRLAARLLIASGLTLVVLAVGSVLIWVFESGVKGGDIHGFGDAVFFTAVQLLTISSAITNPLTAGGRVVDVALEAWAIFVVTAVAGSFAAFFSSGDSG